MKKNWLLKIFFVFCACMMGTSLFAQGLLVAKKDGTTIKIPYELLDRVTVYEAEDASLAIAGVYQGVNKMNVAGSVLTDSACVARIVAQQDGKYTVVLPESTSPQSGNSMTMPHVELTDIVMVKESESVFTFAVAEVTVETSTPSVYIKNLKGTVNTEDNTLALNFEMKPGKMPMSIVNSFLGKKEGATPEVVVPEDMSKCAPADMAALLALAKANPQLGLSESSKPSDWQVLGLSWEKNAEGLYVVKGIDIQKDSQLADFALNLDEKVVFSNLKSIAVASANVKEFAVVNQPALEVVTLNGMGAAAVSAINVQGGVALQHVAIENLPAVSEIFLGGDSISEVVLSDLPSLQEQSNLKFRESYDGSNAKDTKIAKLTIKGNLNKLNGLYLNGLGINEFVLDTQLPELTSLSLNKNHLKGDLTIKGLNKLNSLYLINNDLESIHVSECAVLKEFDASSNKQLSSLVLDVPSLTSMSASESNLTALDITHLTSLKNLSVSQSKLATLTFSGVNAALERINLSNNQLTSFVLPAEVTEPYQLYLSNNRLNTLDLKNAGYLEELYISNNDLTSFVLPDEKEMIGTIECGGNHFDINFLRSIEDHFTDLSEMVAAPQTIPSRVNGRKVDASVEIAAGLEPYVVKMEGEQWVEMTDIVAADGIFTLPEGGNYRVICTEDIFKSALGVIFNMEFSFETPYIIGEVK